MNSPGDCFAWSRMFALFSTSLFGLLSVFAVGCSSESPTSGVTTVSAATMGTRYTVRLIVTGEEEAVDWQVTIDQRLVDVNARMSTYDPGSELSRFNASDTTDWFEVSAETASLVAYSLELAADSGGAFDPTVGPIVNLWGFGPGDSRFDPPVDEEISSALEHVGFQKVEARLDPPALRKKDPKVYLDLSAVAKGYGVDAVAELIESKGIASYMVEIGGEVRTKGNKPNGDPWRIGIEKPDSQGGVLQAVLSLGGQAVATSGDYRNYFTYEGKRFSHTIDPVTGKPVKHALATVSVLSPNCREADALATTLLVMGPQAGYDWARDRSIAALFVSRSDEDHLIERATPAWVEADVTAEKTP